MTTLFCTRCGAEITAAQRFCGNCGRKLQKASVKKPILLISGAVCVSVIFLLVSGALVGNKPTQQMERTRLAQNSANEGSMPQDAIHDSGSHDNNGGSPNDDAPGGAGMAADSAGSEDTASYDAADSDSKEPTDAKALSTKAFTLVDALAGSGGSDKQLVLETIDVLSRLVRADPTNSWALLQLAELSFAQQVFDKAASYYERYLQLVPDDKAVRARYAGSLNFIGKSQQAVAELEPLRQSDPDNFQILGYLAVSYAQAGNVEKAKEIGALAVQKAPDDSARARFTSFVEKLNSNPVSAPADNAAPSAPTDGKVDLAKLQTYLKNHQIAGRFFVGADQEGSTIVLRFNNFPMQAMPEFVRNKFIANVTEQLPPNAGLHLKFVENATGDVLYEK